jgi:hypothetical protein
MAVTPSGLLKDVRDLAARIEADGRQVPCARTLTAIAELSGALQHDFNLAGVEPIRNKRSACEAKLARQLQYQKRTRSDVEEELQKLKGAKDRGMLRSDVLVKVCLSDPCFNRREVQELLSCDCRAVISASSIDRVRDAFAEMLKMLVRQKVAAQVAVGVSDSKDTPPVYVLHIHDEASMRFRSYDRVEVESFGGRCGGPVFSRGRYSKVQNNAITITTSPGAQPIEWLSELQPLSRKNGLTLATAIGASIEEVMKACTGELSGRKPLRFLHVLVGDGVNTNENSGKRLLQKFMLSGSADNNVQYRLLVWKCSSHQANLVVLVAIAGGLVANPLESNELCGTLSRLYKFLVPAYLDEFTAVLRNMVVATFRVCHDTFSEDTKRHQDTSQALVALYGDAVLPPALMRLRNRDLSSMEHLCPAGTDERVPRKDMFDLLLRLVWLVEEKPVITRFFLFAPCCFALLRMLLLGLPADVFSAGLLGLETESSKRLQAVKAFYSHPGTPKLLRRVCLCLRLTMFATSLAAKKKHRNADVPVIVALGRGEVQERTANLFATIVPLLTNDPVLDAADAFRALLLTLTHLVIRFDMYLRYPTKLWMLTRKYNQELYAIEILDFLHTDDKLLDAGYSALLKREAWSFGNNVEADAVGYMMSTAVQSELAGLFLVATANSLDVERKHALDKQFETTKVTGCATASRNCIIRRYLAVRRDALHSKLDVQRSAKSALTLNVRAIAFERNPEMFTRGRGKMRWEESVSGKDMKAIAHQGDEIALQQYIEEHRGELEAELSDRRHVAKCRAVAASALPLSQDEWLRHLDVNDEEFRGLLRNAHTARRVISERLQPDAEWGAAPRLYPQVCREHGHVPQWSHLKPEFYCFKQTDTFSLVCYVASIGHTVYACPLFSTPVHNEFDLVFQPSFHKSLQSIAVVFAKAGITDDAAAYKLWWVPQRFGIDRVTIRMDGAEPAVPPTRAKSKAKSSHEEHVEPEDDDEFEAFLEKVEGFAARDSDCDSLCSSQDTDQSSSDQANDSESNDEATMPKKAPGTYVVYTNGYFTFTDNKDYPDIKVRVLDRWCTKGFMGVSAKSKTVLPRSFGEERTDCKRSMWVLKAWMLWKSRTNDFCNQRAGRRRLFVKEQEDLRNLIVAASSETAPTSGDVTADSLIAKWAPLVLAPLML